MAGLIPQSFINDLLGRVDIVDVIGSRVQLKKAGANHKGLCPFHNEKTPSFSVNQDKQFYYCFGCEASGTVVTFLMEHDSLTFPEAVESLASMVGVEVPREQGAAEEKPDTGIYDVLDAAAARFRTWLRSKEDGAAAVAYLKGRGLSGEIARDYGIGLAPPGWSRLKTALASFGEQRLIDAGLLLRNERGRVYDRFRERIMFPIRSMQGRVIGFGGRVYGDGQPKYINSPETQVFHKGRELYGLYEARRASRGLQSVVVVEGYMDVVALAQHGVGNAVATLGTAIGQPHFDTLYRRVNLVVCCFDGDEAGRGAAWKAVDAAFPVLSETRQLKFVFLPEGEDPDSIVRSRGRDHFLGLLGAAMPVGEYFLDHLQTGLDLEAADGRALLAELALPHLHRLPRGALRQILVDSVAARAGIDASALERAVGDVVLPDNRPRTGHPPAGGGPLTARGERLLNWVVKCPELVGDLAAESREKLAADTNLLADVVRYLMEEPDTDTGTLLGRFVGHAAYDDLVAAARQHKDLPRHQVADFQSAVQGYLMQRDGMALARKAIESGSLEDLRRLSDAKRQQAL